MGCIFIETNPTTYIKNCNTYFYTYAYAWSWKTHMSSCLQLKFKVIGNVLIIIKKTKFIIKMPAKLGSLAYGTFV